MLHIRFNFQLLTAHAIITGFYPYRSIVNNRILEIEDNEAARKNEYSDDENSVLMFFDTMKAKAQTLGCEWDNKVVIEITVPTMPDKFAVAGKMYLGYKDNMCSLGLSMWQPDSYTAQYNKRFNVIGYNCANGHFMSKPGKCKYPMCDKYCDSPELKEVKV